MYSYKFKLYYSNQKEHVSFNWVHTLCTRVVATNHVHSSRDFISKKCDQILAAYLNLCILQSDIK